MSERLDGNLGTNPDNLCKTHVSNKTQSQNTFHTYVQNISDVTFDNEET